MQDYDPLIVVNEKIRIVDDKQQLTIKETNTFLNSIINQTVAESKIKKDRCQICNSKEDSKNLQNHHIGGRKHDHRQITVCILCHRELTERQDVWDARWRSENQSENLRVAFFYMGLYDILMLKAKRTNQSVYSELASHLTETILMLLKSE